MVNFDRCNGCRNTFDDLYYKICVPNKIEVEHFYNDSKNKSIKNINKKYIMRM